MAAAVSGPMPATRCNWAALALEDGGGFGEVLEQLARAHRADAINKIQSHQSFAGIHARS
jgi:hypothetical protein